MIWSQFVLGAITFFAGLYPALLNLPADILSLNNFPGGRIITFLLVAVAIILIRLQSLTSSHSQMQLELSHLFKASMTGMIMREYGDKLSTIDILVILPCYNEAEGLDQLLPTIPKHIMGRSVAALVVDDGSTDGSDAVARSHGFMVVSHPAKMGGGRALQTGFALAQTLEAQVVVTMDADCQHDPAEMEPLVEPILSGHADLVIGSRVLGQHQAASRSRSIGVSVFGWAISLLSGSRITDCASGYRAIRTAVLPKLRLRQAQYHTAEFIIQMLKVGGRIQERPITIHLRQHGVSKKGHDFFYGLRFARSVLKSWLR